MFQSLRLLSSCLNVLSSSSSFVTSSPCSRSNSSKISLNDPELSNSIGIFLDDRHITYSVFLLRAGLLL